jgi:hypothetical protein
MTPHERVELYDNTENITESIGNTILESLFSVVLNCIEKCKKYKKESD